MFNARIYAAVFICIILMFYLENISAHPFGSHFRGGHRGDSGSYTFVAESRVVGIRHFIS